MGSGIMGAWSGKERESRLSNKYNSNKAKLAASSRWSKGTLRPAVDDASNAPSIAASIAKAMPGDAKSESESESELLRTLFSEEPNKKTQISQYALPEHISRKDQQHRDLSTSLRFGRDDKGEDDAAPEQSLSRSSFSSTRVGRRPPGERTNLSVSDARHTRFRAILAEYWKAKNHASPEMPWQGRDAKALSDFLAASPNLSETQFRQMLGNRAKSAVAHGDRVYLWIGNLTRFQEEITVYNKPASAGGGHASRAEINRNSVVSAVDRALELAREHADRAGQAGPEQTAFADTGMSLADGAGPDRCALAIPGNGDHGMAAGHAADGQTGTDGPLPHRPATAGSGKTHRAGGQEVTAW